MNTRPSAQDSCTSVLVSKEHSNPCPKTVCSYRQDLRVGLAYYATARVYGSASIAENIGDGRSVLSLEGAVLVHVNIIRGTTRLYNKIQALSIKNTKTDEVLHVTREEYCKHGKVYIS